jgi:hypothetical protein
MKFAVGEVALLQDLRQDYAMYNGREVEITACLGIQRGEGDDPWYEVRAPWISELHPAAYAVDLAEEHLRKRREPPDWNAMAARDSTPVRESEPA